MTALPSPAAMFASAYRQLRLDERQFVDAVVRRLEEQADRENERISLALYRPLPEAIVAASNGMLERALVTAAIAERINEIASQRELTHARIIREYMNIAFANVNDYITFDPETGIPVFDLSRCTPEQLSAIASIEVEESGSGNRLEANVKRKVKIKWHDKLTALAKLAEHTGLLESGNPTYREYENQVQKIGINDDSATAAERYTKLLGDD